MADFNFGIDCDGDEIAITLGKHIETIELFQEELDVCEERVSLVSKQSLLDELKKFSSTHNTTLSVEVWPEGMDYDEAEESGDLETHDIS